VRTHAPPRDGPTLRRGVADRRFAVFPSRARSLYLAGLVAGKGGDGNPRLVIAGARLNGEERNGCTRYNSISRRTGQGPALRSCRIDMRTMTCSSVMFWMPYPKTAWQVWSIRFLRARQNLIRECCDIAQECGGGDRTQCSRPCDHLRKDILIYCISQLMAKKNAGEALAQTLHLNAHDLLV